MKLDMDLARRILLALEELPDSKGPRLMFELPGEDKAAVWFHTRMLSEAGLLDAFEYRVMGDGPPEWYPINLTYAGHVFLEEARSDTRWSAAKRFVVDKGGALTLDILKGVLAQLARSVIAPGPS